jgi:hypothetical protein
MNEMKNGLACNIALYRVLSRLPYWFCRSSATSSARGHRLSRVLLIVCLHCSIPREFPQLCH